MDEQNRRRFSRLFKGRETCKGRYLDGPKKRIQTIKEPPTDEEWDAHLEGEGPYLGIVPITLDDTCYFGAIDWDDDDADHVALERQVRSLNLPLVVCRSKSGGAHLYVFLSEPAPAALVVSKLAQWKEALQLENPAPEGKKPPPVEIFPKQVRTKPDDTGNWINLPYYGGDDTNRFAVHNGQPLDLAEFLHLAEQKQLSAVGLEAREIELSVSSPIFFNDGPPCLQTLQTTETGLAQTYRNQTLFNVAVFLRLKYPDEWEEKVSEYNRENFDPALPEREVEALIKSVSDKDYIYKCSEDPISSVCQKRACKTQLYGIDVFRKKQAIAALPHLSHLRCVLADPPYWLLNVEGHTVRLETDELLSFDKFRESVMTQTRTFVRSGLKRNEWEDELEDLMKAKKDVPVPPDAGPVGQLKLRLSEFLALRGRSQSMEGLLQGKPYGQNGKVYFRSLDLLEYLERKRVKGYTEAREVWSVLEKLGAGSTRVDIKGARVEAWWLPTPSDEQTEDFDLPTREEDEF